MLGDITSHNAVQCEVVFFADAMKLVQSQCRQHEWAQNIIGSGAAWYAVTTQTSVWLYGTEQWTMGTT